MIIVIASMGRCGSTALYHALLKSLPEYSGIFVRDLKHAQLRDGLIVKTHDFSPEIIQDNWRVIYCFGDEEIILKSINRQNEDWKAAHAYNLHSNGDNLRLKENITSWRNASGKILFINYDKLFESAEIISEFLRPKIELPTRIKRETE